MPPKTLDRLMNESLSGYINRTLMDSLKYPTYEVDSYGDMIKKWDGYIDKYQKKTVLPEGSAIDYDKLRIDYDKLREAMEKMNEPKTVRIKKGDINIEVDIDVVIEALREHAPDEFF